MADLVNQTSHQCPGKNGWEQKRGPTAALVYSFVEATVQRKSLCMQRVHRSCRGIPVKKNSWRLFMSKGLWMGIGAHRDVGIWCFSWLMEQGKSWFGSMVVSNLYCIRYVYGYYLVIPGGASTPEKMPSTQAAGECTKADSRWIRWIRLRIKIPRHWHWMILGWIIYTFWV